MMTIPAKIRKSQLRSSVEACGRIYRSEVADIQGYQLEKLNALWHDIQRNVPYYRELVRSNFLPSELQGWTDFEKFPVLTRTSLQEDATRYIDTSQKIVGWTTTGGSTGTPFRIPYSSLESRTMMANAWLGREYFNIHIADRMFHLWGHSHLFGRGWRRYVKQTQRMIKNWLLGHQVFSAYHLTPQRLHQAGNAILKMRPDFIMGYSRSLLLLARENADLSPTFRQLRLKAVIATTEAFSQPEDAEFIASVFGCPVGMEYGAAETGVIAYTHPADNRYRVFWDTYLLEAVPVNQTDAKLLLTALYPRALPLIRYDIGDIVQSYDTDGNSAVGFARVLGRDNDLIDIGDGAHVHPVALIHCIQSTSGVLGVQVVQELDKSLSIRIMCSAPLSVDADAAIRQNLSTLDPQLRNCKIAYTEQLEQTLAGKTRWVVKR
jgi:phenylacetate-coenzyme A ligase PaaK-like adenylate-forming protein